MWGCNSGFSRDCSFLLIILVLRTSKSSFVRLHSRILFKKHANCFYLFFYALFHLNCILGNCHAKYLKPKVHNRILDPLKTGFNWNKSPTARIEIPAICFLEPVICCSLWWMYCNIPFAGIWNKPCIVFPMMRKAACPVGAANKTFGSLGLLFGSLLKYRIRLEKKIWPILFF